MEHFWHLHLCHIYLLNRDIYHLSLYSKQYYPIYNLINIALNDNAKFYSGAQKDCTRCVHGHFKCSIASQPD